MTLFFGEGLSHLRVCDAWKVEVGSSFDSFSIADSFYHQNLGIRFFPTLTVECVGLLWQCCVDRALHPYQDETICFHQDGSILPLCVSDL